MLPVVTKVTEERKSTQLVQNYVAKKLCTKIIILHCEFHMPTPKIAASNSCVSIVSEQASYVSLRYFWIIAVLNTL